MEKSESIAKKWWARKCSFKAFFAFVMLCGFLFLGLIMWVLGDIFEQPVCDRWHSGMTKEDKINLVLTAVNEDRAPAFKFYAENHESYLRNYKQIPYTNILEILKNNPRCCNIISHDNTDDFSEGDEGIVSVQYNGKYVGTDKKVHEGEIFATTDLNYCKN